MQAANDSNLMAEKATEGANMVMSAAEITTALVKQAKAAAEAATKAANEAQEALAAQQRMSEETQQARKNEMADFLRTWLGANKMMNRVIEGQLARLEQ
jgi:hypothetical protein